MWTKYLNDGKGEACAGQVRAIPEPDVYRKVADFAKEENLGAAVPTGSKKFDISFDSIFSSTWMKVKVKPVLDKLEQFLFQMCTGKLRTLKMKKI